MFIICSLLSELFHLNEYKLPHIVSCLLSGRVIIDQIHNQKCKFKSWGHFNSMPLRFGCVSTFADTDTYDTRFHWILYESTCVYQCVIPCEHLRMQYQYFNQEQVIFLCVRALRIPRHRYVRYTNDIVFWLCMVAEMHNNVMHFWW